MDIVFWDIEAGGLKSPFDQLLSSAFKPYGDKPYAILRRARDVDDRELCIKIRNELESYDCFVTYYGLRYDKPFLNGRLYKYGERPLKRMKHIDCYSLACKIFKYTLHSKRLITICEHLGIKGKTRVVPADWEQVKYAAHGKSREALRRIAEHNLWDVIALEEAYVKCFKEEIRGFSET
jgi:uncharacterized protein YprB with RNaseH-like and TPR domain